MQPHNKQWHHRQESRNPLRTCQLELNCCQLKLICCKLIVYCCHSDLSSKWELQGRLQAGWSNRRRLTVKASARRGRLTGRGKMNFSSRHTYRKLCVSLGARLSPPSPGVSAISKKDIYIYIYICYDICFSLCWRPCRHQQLASEGR